MDHVFEATDRIWMEELVPYDEHLSREGRVMEVLSEHLCQGWLEGYLLTGRHGLFACYEEFAHVIDSMFNQHAKWLKVSRPLGWRRPIASLNYLLTSHVWRQDHNGFTHQDPGFVDLVTRRRTSCASTLRRTRIACCGRSSIACAPTAALKGAMSMAIPLAAARS
jgi:xylulose-5-phosphate/fructose-6-phosphate phosphoketolase